MARPAEPGDLTSTVKAFETFAAEAGWWTVATVGDREVEVEVRHGSRKEDWTWTREVERSLQVRGFKGTHGQFVVAWYLIPGKSAEAVCYWWSREHEVIIHGFPAPTSEAERVRCDPALGDERVAWTTEQAWPKKVPDLTDLRALIAPEVKVEHRRSRPWVEAMAAARKAGVDPAQLARWEEERSDLAAVRKATTEALAASPRP